MSGRATLTFKEFEDLVGQAFLDLPEQFRNILIKNEISLLPRETPPKPLLNEHKGSIVFGVFIGVPLGRIADIQTEPTRIELYKESFETFYKTPEQIKQQIKTTVIHEIAHYFGFSEKKIRKLGY